MTMVNLKNITSAVKTMLDNGLTGYTIERNPERNVDPSVASRGSGWIGVYRGGIEYKPYSIGAAPWLCEATVIVEVQAASMLSAEDAEDRLQTAEQAVLAVLNGDKTLGGTVDMTNGYHVEYQYNKDNAIYYHASIITLMCEVRA